MSSTKQDWTIEPWPQLVEMPPRPDIPEAREYLTECCGSVLLNASHYARAKACVDPLAGIPDPAAYISAMREALAVIASMPNARSISPPLVPEMLDKAISLASNAFDSLRTLSTPESKAVDDGQEQTDKCGPDCTLEVLRPGQVQCNRDGAKCPNRNDNGTERKEAKR